MTRLLHARHGLAIDTRKRRIGAVFDAQHARHGNSRGIDAIDAAGGQQVAVDHIGVAGHEAQFDVAAAAGRGVAIGDAARAGARIENGNRLVTIDQQRDFAAQRIDPRDLAQHAIGIEHGRAQRDARSLAAVYHHAAGIGVGRVMHHFGGLARTRQVLAQREQGAQMQVLVEQLLGQMRALRDLDQALIGGTGLRLGLFHRLHIFGALMDQGHGLDHQPLHGVEHAGHDLAHRLGQFEARVGNHQKQRQGAVESQLRQQRRALAKQRGHAPINGSQRHQTCPCAACVACSEKSCTCMSFTSRPPPQCSLVHSLTKMLP